MPRRTAQAGTTSAPRREVTGSAFDPGQSDPPRLPTGLPAPVRKMAKVIIEGNPHLDHPQVEAIVRLARMRIRVQEMEQQVESEGFTIFDEKKGRDIPHPLLTSLNTSANSVLSLERALGVAWVTKTGQAKAHEKHRPAKLGSTVDVAAPGDDGVARQLRLA